MKIGHRRGAVRNPAVVVDLYAYQLGRRRWGRVLLLTTDLAADLGRALFLVAYLGALALLPLTGLLGLLAWAGWLPSQ
jgi:fatty acid desaturase